MLKQYSPLTKKVNMPLDWEEIKNTVVKINGFGYNDRSYLIADELKDIIRELYEKECIFYCNEEDIDYKPISTEYAIGGDTAIISYLRIFLNALLDESVYLLNKIEINTTTKQFTLYLFSLKSNEYMLMDVVGALKAFERNIIIDELLDTI